MINRKKSKQLNFYITPDDYQLINKFLMENNCLILVDNYISIDRNPVYELISIEDNIYQIYITKNLFLNEIEIEKTENNIFYFDKLRSSIIQFGLGGFYKNSKDNLNRARLYFESNYYQNGKLIYKNPSFIEWSELILKSFKNTFLLKYKGDKLNLYSLNAIKWIEENNAIEINGGQQWKITAPAAFAPKAIQVTPPPAHITKKPF